MKQKNYMRSTYIVEPFIIITSSIRKENIYNKRRNTPTKRKIDSDREQ